MWLKRQMVVYRAVVKDRGHQLHSLVDSVQVLEVRCQLLIDEAAETINSVYFSISWRSK